MLQLRDPMEVLKELSVEYNKLGESDIKRTNLLNAVGSKLRSTQLDALLRQWSMYEEMLQQYEAGNGSMAREAEKTANSLEGRLNSLSNSWIKFIQNFINTDFIKGSLSGVTKLIDGVDILIDKFGVFGGVVAPILSTILAIKNKGEDKMISFNVMPFLNCNNEFIF